MSGARTVPRGNKPSPCADLPSSTADQGRDGAELASKLIASVDGEADADCDDAWLAELDRREAEAAAGGDSGASWSDVKARIVGRLESR